MARFALSLLAVLSLIAATVSGAGGEKKATPTDNPDGTWVVIGMEQYGMKLPPEALDKLEFSAKEGSGHTLILYKREAKRKGD